MRVVRITDDASRRVALREGGELLRAGRLVAFPTETVYGLGANALDARAVQRIYDAKGRPAMNPIIVHVATIQEAEALALEWTPAAAAIARAFWPGPITLVVRKRPTVPDIVSAGTATVGVRVPAHPIALGLIEEAQVPVAAPSANRSTQVSPTTAQHVERGLGERVDLLIDGGPTSVGIESTVVDVTGDVPRILRPGMIARAAIARVAGSAESQLVHAVEGTPRSPGLMGKHYSPRARVVLADRAALLAGMPARAGERVGVMSFEPPPAATDVVKVMPRRADEYARLLYATVHELDEAGCDVIVIERPPSSPEWDAITDRLERSAR